MPMIEFATPTGALPGYLARPDGPGPWPAVVVVHDAFGLSDDIRRITDRFAAAGYLALAPALFRHGHRAGCIIRTFRALAEGRGHAVDNLIAARDHLVADRHGTGRVAAAGFCMGGGFCLLLGPRGVFDAIAPNYGVSPQGLDAMQDSCPTVASYGRRDLMLRGAAATLEQRLTEGGVAHDVREYPDVGHSFMNDWPTPAALGVVERTAGVAYSEPEAEDAWRRILAFFEEHLSGPHDRR